MADHLADGSRLRALTVVDVFSREALAIEVGKRLRAEDVVSVPNRLVAQRRAPRFLFADNGSEFSGRLLDMWAYHYKVQIDFSRPGRPTDNSPRHAASGMTRVMPTPRLCRVMNPRTQRLGGSLFPVAPVVGIIREPPGRRATDLEVCSVSVQHHSPSHARARVP